MNQVLVVIDMQWEFLKEIQNVHQMYKLIQNICHKIDAFKEKGLPIVIVEYVLDDVLKNNSIRNLYTAKKIIDRVKNYPHLYYATKIEDGGGREIVRALNGYSYLHSYDMLYQNSFINNKPFSLTPQTIFCLCGINTTACVLDTAMDLHRLGFQSTIAMFCSLDTYTNEWAYENTILFEEDIQKIVQLTA